MATQRVGVIMNGVTGRMGLNQHLVRSILAIRELGGVALPNGDRSEERRVGKECRSRWSPYH